MKTKYTFNTVEQLLIILRTPSNCKLIPMALIYMYNPTSPYGKLHNMVSEFFTKKKKSKNMCFFAVQFEKTDRDKYFAKRMEKPFFTLGWREKLF